MIVTESPLLLDHMDDIEVMRRGSVIGRGTHGELMRRDDDVGDLYRSVVARTTSAAEPVDAGELDEAWTGSIDALWTDAVETGAIRTAKPRRERGDDDASADR